MKTLRIIPACRFSASCSADRQPRARAAMLRILLLCVTLFYLPGRTWGIDRSDDERYKDRYTGKYLYTKPDASAGGGITARIKGPNDPIAAVFALPPDEPRFCYRGEVTGDDRRGLLFEGLPVAKYDLFIVYDGKVYDGLTLQRGESDLTRQDRQLAEATVQKAEPFFDTKFLHRLEGKTGVKTGAARGIGTFLRTKPMIDYAGNPYSDHRQAYKLILFEHVGPGWQITRTREIFATFVKPGTRESRFVYRRALGRIRVTDSMKDLGELNLLVAESSE